VEGTPFGTLIMLRLPDDGFVTIELVHDPAKGAVDLGSGISHLVIQVESLGPALADLAARGIAGRHGPGQNSPAGGRLICGYV
jgi:lactoylglutathione lyase